MPGRRWRELAGLPDGKGGRGGFRDKLGRNSQDVVGEGLAGALGVRLAPGVENDATGYVDPDGTVAAHPRDSYPIRRQRRPGPWRNDHGLAAEWRGPGYEHVSCQ